MNILGCKYLKSFCFMQREFCIYYLLPLNLYFAQSSSSMFTTLLLCWPCSTPWTRLKRSCSSWVVSSLRLTSQWPHSCLTVTLQWLMPTLLRDCSVFVSTLSRWRFCSSYFLFCKAVIIAHSIKCHFSFKVSLLHMFRIILSGVVHWLGQLGRRP